MFFSSRIHGKLPRRFGALMVSGALVASFAGLAGTNPAGAGTIGPIDFEQPTYVLGSIDGQDGWSSTGSADGASPGYDHAVAAQSLYGSFGDQSLRISNAVTSGSFGDQTFSKPLSDGAGETGALDNGFSGGVLQPRFAAEWAFAPTVASPQPGLSVVASPDRGDGSRMSWVQMADTGDADGLDVNFYDVQGMSPETECGAPTRVPCANFVQSPVASGLSRTEPHTIKITIDFLDGPSNDVVKVYVDGVLSHTGTTWEDYYNTDNEAKPEGGPRTVDSMLFRTSGAPVAATLGEGFLIDGLRLSSGAIPIATSPTAPGKNYDGNMKCADMAPDGITWEEFKIDGVPNDGDHKIPNTDLVITISNASSQTFDWESNFDMSAVLVKGSNGGIHYQYPGTNDRSDTGLHALVHDETKENPYHDISHVTFCYQVGGDTVDVLPTESDNPESENPASENPASENPAPVNPQLVNPASDEIKTKTKTEPETTVLGETLVQGDTLPRTGAAATHALALTGGLGLALGLMMLMLANRKTAAHNS